MALEKDFKLKFGSLSLGSHEYLYELTDENFQHRDEALVKEGLVKVLLHVEKAERHLSLEYKLAGSVRRECDICLSALDYPVESAWSIMVKITDEKRADEVDLIHLSSNTTELELEDYFYDSVVLSLPMKIKCSDSLNREECDQKVLDILNIEEEAETPNPEWQKLRDLFNKN